jgi:mono/diheme cytochrome c family protein
MRRLLPLVVLALALAGCGGGTEAGPFPKTVIGTVAKGPSGSAAGKALFAQNGCGGCHTYKPASSTGKVGPDLDNLVTDAQKANHGTVEAYTKESIENPDAYIVPGFSKGVMPAFAGKLTDSQVDELVSFLTKP